MGHTRDNAFAAVLIQPLEVRPIGRRLGIYLDGTGGSWLVESHLLVKKAADGPKALPLAEQRPAIDVVAIDRHIDFKKWTQCSNAQPYMAKPCQRLI